MKVSLIVAKAANNAIGKDNDLLWHLPADMKFFKQTTSGHCVITGRKNYESIPERFRPLPNRTNIVVTRDTGYVAEGAVVVHDIHAALEHARSLGEEEALVIGGGQIYKAFLDAGLIDTMYITQVSKDFEADVFFPEFKEEEWSTLNETSIDVKEDHDFTAKVVVYQKK